MKRRYKFLAGIAIAALLVWFATGVAAAYVFANVTRGGDFQDPKEIAGTPVEAIELTTRDNIRLSAWHVKNNADRIVLFAHGIGSNRRQGKRTAEMYQDWGYSLLMVDARGHGKSAAAPCTIGWDERLDLAAAYDFARAAGYTTIAAHGVSMGAATILYSLEEDLQYDFIVLESCYDTIDNALRNRVAMLGAPYAITWPFRWATTRITGVREDQLRPLDFADRAACPILFLAGDSEPELKMTETQGLFDACGAHEKSLHFFAGGRHESFSNHFEEEYQQVLGEFIAAQEPAATIAAAG